MNKTKNNNEGVYGIAGLVLGILSLLIFLMPYFALPMAIIGLVCSNKGKAGLKVSGQVINILSIVLNSVMLFFLLIALLFMGVL